MHLPDQNPPENCPSCGASFKGKYCHKCGEKRVSAKDFQWRKYAQTLAEHFSHFDSKVLRSLRALVLQPGFLSAEYVTGRRNLYVKPLQLFLLLNLAFFLFFGDNDVFSPKLKWVYHSESDSKIWSGERIKDLTDAYAAREQIALETAIKTIDTKSASLTKVLLYLFVPLIGALFFALFFRQNPYYLCHLIFATHWFAFLLLLLMVGGTLIILLFRVNGMPLLMSFLALLQPVHLLATRHFYGGHWVWLVLKTLAFFAAFSALYLLYRDFILFLTLRFL
ncbi:MAG: DUF3667 domain-containing protein [Saprospiraceae bacterium]